jgi:ribokinase
VFSEEDAFAAAAVVVLQLELPLPTVRAAIEQARRHECKIVLDPAPAPRAMPVELFRVDVISPNVSEAEILLDAKPTAERVDKQVAADLLNRGAKAVVLKLGRRGALVAAAADGQFHRVGPYRVPVVDTTGAGDAFTAAMAVAIARGEKLCDAVKFGNAAGALACTKIGAQQAMPTRDEVMLLMADQPL